MSALDWPSLRDAQLTDDELDELIYSQQPGESPMRFYARTSRLAILAWLERNGELEKATTMGYCKETMKQFAHQELKARITMTTHCELLYETLQPKLVA